MNLVAENLVIVVSSSALPWSYKLFTQFRSSSCNSVYEGPRHPGSFLRVWLKDVLSYKSLKPFSECKTDVFCFFFGFALELQYQKEKGRVFKQMPSCLTDQLAFETLPAVVLIINEA